MKVQSKQCTKAQYFPARQRRAGFGTLRAPMSGTEYAIDYLEARGISSPQALTDALRYVLDSMEPKIYESPESGLTAQEQSVLREGGLRLERTGNHDLVAEGAVRFAALVEYSLSADEVAKQLKVTPGRVHQMISNKELYSFRLNGKRLVPAFQFANNKLIPNITQVNKVLPDTMHPLGVFNFLHMENTDLYTDEEQEELLSPLTWLAEGRDADRVVFMAKHL